LEDWAELLFINKAKSERNNSITAAEIDNSNDPNSKLLTRA
jgi:hypothetical protein